MCFTIEQISAIIGIITPIVLLFWFLYTQKQGFNAEFIGIYAGYMESTEKDDPKDRIDSGLIMNRDIVSSGYFRGELDYPANIASESSETFLTDGIYSFYGIISYLIKKDPLKPKENRIYKGKLFIVDRLDIDFEKQKIEDFVKAEYNFTLLREMRAIKFILKYCKEDWSSQLPQKFILHKSLKLGFEPYKNVKDDIFRGFTRVDKG